MHLLRLLVAGWLAFAIPTVSVLFWLCRRTLPLEAEHHQSDLEPVALFNTSMVPVSPNKMMREQILQGDELFWMVATAIAMVAVSVLLLVAWTDRLSPVPARLVVVQHPPLRRAVATKTMVMKPQVTNEQTVDVDWPARSAPAHKTIGKPTRHSSYHGDTDVVALDTVVRYSRSAALQ